MPITWKNVGGIDFGGINTGMKYASEMLDKGIGGLESRLDTLQSNRVAADTQEHARNMGIAYRDILHNTPKLEDQQRMIDQLGLRFGQNPEQVAALQGRLTGDRTAASALDTAQQLNYDTANQYVQNQVQQVQNETALLDKQLYAIAGFDREGYNALMGTSGKSAAEVVAQYMGGDVDSSEVAEAVNWFGRLAQENGMSLNGDLVEFMISRGGFSEQVWSDLQEFHDGQASSAVKELLANRDNLLEQGHQIERYRLNNQKQADALITSLQQGLIAGRTEAERRARQDRFKGGGREAVSYIVEGNDSLRAQLNEARADAKKFLREQGFDTSKKGKSEEEKSTIDEVIDFAVGLLPDGDNPPKPEEFDIGSLSEGEDGQPVESGNWFTNAFGSAPKLSNPQAANRSVQRNPLTKAPAQINTNGGASFDNLNKMLEQTVGQMPKIPQQDLNNLQFDPRIPQSAAPAAPDLQWGNIAFLEQAAARAGMSVEEYLKVLQKHQNTIVNR